MPILIAFLLAGLVGPFPWMDRPLWASTDQCPGLLLVGRPQARLKSLIAAVLDEGQRHHNVHYKTWGRNGLQVQSPAGTYRLRFARQGEAAYPREGLPELAFVDGQVEGEAVLATDFVAESLDRIVGIVRSLWRADPYLHPQLVDPTRPQGGPFLATYPQIDAVERLVGMEALPGLSGRRGLILPTGAGKTFVAARYVQALHSFHGQTGTRGWESFPKVLFVMENELILDQAVETFGRELGFRRVQRVYGDSQRIRARIKPDSEMIAITRSSLHARLRAVANRMENDAQPWVVVLDEGHFAGKLAGQFEDILKALEKTSGGPRRFLYTSATLWHGDQALVRDVLQGQVVAPLLSPQEMDSLRLGQRLSEHCRNQFFRFIERGYLAPLFGIEIVRQVGQGAAELAQALQPNGAGSIPLPVELLADVSRRVKRSRVSGMPDRSVFFVPTRAQADAYAEVLSHSLYPVEPFHRGSGGHAGKWEWFTSGSAQKRSRGLVVVDLLRGGVDFRATNMAVLLRGYGESRAGFRRFMQELGRASRVESGKLHSRVLDYSGISRHLADGLSRISVEARTSSTTGSGAGSIRVDGVSFTPLEFERRRLELFPGEGRFFSEYPYFDAREFVQGGLYAIQKRLGEYGIASQRTAYWPKQISIYLARRLAPSAGRSSLLQALQDDAYWGWKKWDGPLVSDPAKPSLRRFYAALMEIARLFRLEPGQGNLDLDRLHTEGGVEDLLTRLCPWKHSLRSEAAIQAFLGPGGDYRAFISAASRFGAQHLDTPQGIAAYAASLLESLPQSVERDRVLEEVRDPGVWGWRPMDTQPRRSQASSERAWALNESKASYQRIYRLVYALKWLAARPEGFGQALSFAEIVNRFRPLPESVAEEDEVDAMVSEHRGGHLALRSRLHWFGVTRIAQPFAPRTIALALIGEYGPENSERARLVQLYRSQAYGWKPSDGQALLHPSRTAPARLIAALKSAAQLHGYRPDTGDLVWDQEGVGAFLDTVVLGVALGDPTPEVAAGFTGSGGAVEVLQALVREHPTVGSWRQPHALRDLVLWLAQELSGPEGVRIRQSLADVKFWRWGRTDGPGLSDNAFSSTVWRTHRALVWIAKQAAEQTPHSGLDWRQIHTREQMERLVCILKGLYCPSE